MVLMNSRLRIESGTLYQAQKNTEATWQRTME